MEIICQYSSLNEILQNLKELELQKISFTSLIQQKYYLNLLIELCPPHWGWTYYFSLFRRPSSHLVSGVFILSFKLPNLVWVFIGLVACMGLPLVKIAL